MLRGYADRELGTPPHEKTFLTSPIEIKGKRKSGADGSWLQRAISDGSGRAVAANDTGERESRQLSWSCGRSVTAGAHARAAVRPEWTIPNVGGRINGGPNEYVVGWIARADRGDRD